MQISDIENLSSRDPPWKSRPSVRDARNSAPETGILSANARKYRHFLEYPKSLWRDHGGWLGRQDSNLEMAKSIFVRRDGRTMIDSA
jgi:hypothetical protein